MRRAVDLRPTDAGLQLNLGNALKTLGRIDDAIERFRNTLTLAQYNLGNTYTLIGRHENAADAFEKALRAQPNDPAAWNNFGNALSALQKFEEASAAFRRALSLRPRHAGAHNNLGMALNAISDTIGAIDHFRAAIDVESNYAAAHFNLGNLLDTHGHPRDALPAFERAIALQPRFAPAYFGLGHAHAKLRRHAEAVLHFERAVGLDLKYGGVAWLCLGNSQLALASPRAAIRAFEQALRLDAEMPAAHLNRALALLSIGDYVRGLPDYEWRLRTPGSEPAPTLPRWNGEPLPNGTLVVRAEQGFGDTLQFVRFAAYAKKRVGTLVLEVQPSLVPLIAPAAHAARVEVKSKSDGVRMHAARQCPSVRCEPAARARHDHHRRYSRAHALSHRAGRLSLQVVRLAGRTGAAQDRHYVVGTASARRDGLRARRSARAALCARRHRLGPCCSRFSPIRNATSCSHIRTLSRSIASKKA